MKPKPLPIQTYRQVPVGAVFFFGCIGLVSLAVFFMAFGILVGTVGRSGAGAYFLLRAKNLQNKGVADEGVIEYLDWAIALNPQAGEAYHRRCLQYSFLKDDRQAILDCSRSVELEPKNNLAYLHRGHAYYRLENYWEASRDYGQAAQAEGAYSAEASFWKGLSQYEMGLYALAAQDIRKAVEKGYEVHDLYLWLGWAEMKMGEYTSAADSFDIFLQDSPGDIEGLVGRGLSYAWAGNTAEGLTDMNTALSLDESSAFAYLNRAVVHELMKRYDLAIADLETVLKIGGDEDLLRQAEVRLKAIRRLLNQTRR